jgi:hypothetical protein
VLVPQAKHEQGPSSGARARKSDHELEPFRPHTGAVIGSPLIAATLLEEKWSDICGIVRALSVESIERPQGYHTASEGSLISNSHSCMAPFERASYGRFGFGLPTSIFAFYLVVFIRTNKLIKQYKAKKKWILMSAPASSSWV